MSDKRFRDWPVDQVHILPPSVDVYVSDSNHLALFVRDLVRSRLDLAETKGTHTGGQGCPAYDPTMMTALIIYACCLGMHSSRKIARACRERLGFKALTGNQTPNFRTVNRFRTRHLAALRGLFDQVLQHCRDVGLASLDHVAPDGTRIQANASKHKAMSYGRMVKAEPELASETAELRAREAAGESVDGGKPLSDLVADKEQRLARIKEAKADLEAEAEGAAPEDKAQRNSADPECRVMKTRSGYIQRYNAQAAADADNQVIVVHGLTTDGSDQRQPEPMIKAIEASAKELSADSRYCSETSLQILKDSGIRGYVATGRQRNGKAAATRAKAPREGTLREKMAQRLERDGRDSPCWRHKINIYRE